MHVPYIDRRDLISGNPCVVGSFAHMLVRSAASCIALQFLAVGAISDAEVQRASHFIPRTMNWSALWDRTDSCGVWT